MVISDPRTSGTGVATFLSATFAMGGDENNLDPGFKYFAQLHKSGNLKAVGRNLANVQKGEAPITIGYDLQAAVWRDRLTGQVPLEVVVPAEGVFYMPGALMINRWAPHPNLARLITDFVLSDEGQLLFAKGYAHPIRVVAGNLSVPADLKSRPITQLTGQAKYVRDCSDQPGRARHQRRDGGGHRRGGPGVPRDHPVGVPAGRRGRGRGRRHP